MFTSLIQVFKINERRLFVGIQFTNFISSTETLRLSTLEYTSCVHCEHLWFANYIT